MFTKSKKIILLSGTLLLPLKIGARATILSNEGITRTSTVTAIKQVTQDYIIFETLNSVYRIASSLSPEPAEMSVKNLLYACA